MSVRNLICLLLPLILTLFLVLGACSQPAPDPDATADVVDVVETDRPLIPDCDPETLVCFVPEQQYLDCWYPDYTGGGGGGGGPCTPSPEKCNHIDDDCDGLTDEDDNNQGVTKQICDDGNPCTQEYCAGSQGCHYKPLTGKECDDENACTMNDLCQEGVCEGVLLQCNDQNVCTKDWCDSDSGCRHDSVSGVPCDDGDICTQDEYCDQGECSAALVVCDDGNPCTNDWCHPVTGCSFSPNEEPCDDGNACTVDDQCQGGGCTGTLLACTCTQDSDCQDFEDGNFCNGTLHCDTSELPYECKVIPETIVDCPQPKGGSAPCMATVCDPVTAKCGFVGANDFGACDDGNECTVSDQCLGGTCVPGIPLNCDDESTCTNDFCEPTEGCVHQPLSGPCTDGDSCTMADYCLDGVCVAGWTVPCDDGNSCTSDGCDGAGVCAHLSITGIPCNDDDPCTADDVCVEGTCVGLEKEQCCSKDSECKDTNPCTADSCDVATGDCLFLPEPKNGSGCNADSDGCTVGDSCLDGGCVPGPAADCTPALGSCFYGECQSTGADSHDCDVLQSDPGTECEDDLICTVGTTCLADGTCGAGHFKTAGECANQVGVINPCIEGYCEEPGGCAAKPADNGTSCLLPNASVAECAGGFCKPVSCLEGYADCDLIAINGCETNILLDPDHCGECGLACASDGYAQALVGCVQGECAFLGCAEGFVDENGDCADGGACQDGCETPDCVALADGSFEIPDDGHDADCDGSESNNTEIHGYYVDGEFQFGPECPDPGLGTRLCPFESPVVAISAAQNDQNWSNPAAVRKEIYVAQGNYVETGIVADITKPLILLGGYERTAAGPWLRDWESNTTLLLSDQSKAVVVTAASGYAVVDGFTVDPEVVVGTNVVLRHLTTVGPLQPLDITSKEASKSVFIISCDLGGDIVGGVGSKSWAIRDCAISGNVTGDVTSKGWLLRSCNVAGKVENGDSFKLVGNTIGGKVTGGEKWILENNEVGQGIEGLGYWVLTGNTVVGKVSGTAVWQLGGNSIKGAVAGEDGWLLSGNTITGKVAGGHEWNMSGNTLLGAVGGKCDSWVLTNNRLEGKVSGRDNWHLAGNIVMAPVSGKSSWGLSNNTFYVADAALAGVSMSGADWGLVNNLFIWLGEADAVAYAIGEAGEDADPKIVRNNAFVRFGLDGGGLYLDEGTAALANVLALNETVDLPMCGQGGNVFFANLADAKLTSLEPASPDFLIPLADSDLVDAGLMLPYGCMGTQIKAPLQDMAGQDVPCLDSFDQGCFEYCGQ